MLFKQKPIFSINYFGSNNFILNIPKNISDNDIKDLVSFLYVLSFQSPYLVNIINQIKNDKSIDSKISNSILQKLSELYLSDTSYPVVSPLNAFKQNVK